jgi:hypothetical protein
MMLNQRGTPEVLLVSPLLVQLHCDVLSSSSMLKASIESYYSSSSS